MKSFTTLVLAFVVMFFGQSLESWIVRLSPTAFPELPANLVQELQRRQCTIPQEAYSKTKPNNVIKGEFAASGQTDWAVLCSVKGVSTILVFGNGSEKNPAAIAPMEDRNYLQTKRTGACSGYSRRITPVGKGFIMRHHDPYSGPTPPVDHQGIDDAFVEHGSVTWYFHHGKWLKLNGAD